MFRPSATFFSLLLFAATFGLSACGSGEGQPEPASEPVSAYDLFMDNLRAECGNAYAGRLTLEPEGDTMLDGRELLLVHFRECEEDVIRVPFHIEKLDGEWDRSRTLR